MKNPSAPRCPTSDHGRIVDEDSCLDVLQLKRLEEEFRSWSKKSHRADILLSRKRILLLFLLIRYTGAKLHEVLLLDPADINHEYLFITYKTGKNSRTVSFSESLSNELRGFFFDVLFQPGGPFSLGVDPAFVRRKFYERAQACGFSKRLGAPEMIRKARGVELIRSNMPLPAVQNYLGHSSLALTSAYVSFSKDEIKNLTSLFLKREDNRTSSARNSFFGKVTAIRQDEILSDVELTTPDGHKITARITMESLKRLGIREGQLITAEIKATAIALDSATLEPSCSLENRIPCTVENIRQGTLASECLLKTEQGPKLCAVLSTTALLRLNICLGRTVWALFGSDKVVLRVE